MVSAPISHSRVSVLLIVPSRKGVILKVVWSHKTHVYPYPEVIVML